VSCVAYETGQTIYVIKFLSDYIAIERKRSIKTIKIAAGVISMMDWLSYGTWIIGKNIKNSALRPVITQLGLTGLFSHILGIVYLYALVIQATVPTKKKVEKTGSLEKGSIQTTATHLSV
jgi:hypothetical protein